MGAQGCQKLCVLPSRPVRPLGDCLPAALEDGCGHAPASGPGGPIHLSSGSGSLKPLMSPSTWGTAVTPNTCVRPCCGTERETSVGPSTAVGVISTARKVTRRLRTRGRWEVTRRQDRGAASASEELKHPERKERGHRAGVRGHQSTGESWGWAGMAKMT